MDNRQNIQSFGRFVVRTPALPFANFFNFVSRDDVSVKKLKRIYRNTRIQEALYLASPQLFMQTQKWLAGEKMSEKNITKLQNTLLCYYSRMCSRPTPFGLFASLAVGDIDDKTSISFEKSDMDIRKISIDFEVSATIMRKLAQDKDTNKIFRYVANSSIYPVGESLRYVEQRIDASNKYKNSVVQIDNNEYLDRLLLEVSEGSTIEEMVKMLIDWGVDEGDAKDYIYELISNQVFVPIESPAITRPYQLKAMVKLLLSNNSIAENSLSKQVQNIYNESVKLENTSGDSFIKAANNLSKLAANFDENFKGKNVLFCNSYKKVKSAEISDTIFSLISDALDVVMRLKQVETNPNIEEFIDAFTERYGENTQPLARVLDVDNGIGYPSYSRAGIAPLIDDLEFKANVSHKTEKTTSKDDFLFQLYEQALQDQANEILIDEEKISNFNANYSQLPDTFNIIFSIVDSGNSLEHCELVLQGAGGTSALPLLGRFASEHTELAQLCTEIATYEQNKYPNSIVSEITHLPNYRSGNVLCHKSFHNFEIPYLSAANVSSKNKILITDILISIKNNAIVLIHKYSGQTIIPKLSNAHNVTTNDLPMYHFLTDLQNQNKLNHISFDWGAKLSNAKFLPRVIYKTVVLSPATWHLNYEELIDFETIKDTMEFYTKFHAWRVTKQMPAWINLIDFDNNLVLNLNNLNFQHIFIAKAKKMKTFTVTEFLFDPDNVNVFSDDGAYTNEIVVPVYHK